MNIFEYFYLNLHDFLILIPLIPFIGFVINGLWGKRYSTQTVNIIGCTTIFISFVISFLALIKVLSGTPVLYFKGFEWMVTYVEGYKFVIPFSFKIDVLSAIMINVVSGVGFLIHVYSMGYMKGDSGLSRFFSYMNLFCFAMLTLVMADNILLMFLGWEGVGLCSYLLIGFWYNDINNSIAGKKAFIMNRVGDFGFLLGIFLLFIYFGDLRFDGIQKSMNAVLIDSKEIILPITLLLFLGATGKSAQIPLYTWLPDAMAGPTPVSALIHAATMVTAGVYMIGRLHFLFAASELTMFIVMALGALTSLLAGTIGLTQRDIKKVLAYSTISQLGYMFMAMAAGAFAVGIFHLMTHAFFKALLFLGAGSVIVACHHEQDMFKMGGLRKRLPITYWTLIIGALALSGFFPFISGFLSKDQILENTYLKSYFGSHTWGMVFWIVGVVSAALTSLYTWRLIGLTFHGKPRMSAKEFSHVSESPISMRIVLVILAFLSLFGGLVSIPEILGGTNWFVNLLNHGIFGVHHHVPHGSLPYILMLISAGIGFVMFLFIFSVYRKDSKLPDKIIAKGIGKTAYQISYNKYWIDEIYEVLFVKSIYKLAIALWKWIDVNVIDGFANGLAKTVSLIGNYGRRIQTGSFNVYALLILIGTLIILGYLIFM